MPVYIFIAAFAAALSIPVMWCALAADRVPGRRVNRNLRAGRNRSTDQRQMCCPCRRWSASCSPFSPPSGAVPAA